MACLIRTSAALVPSLGRVVLKFLNLITSTSFSPFMVMSALVLVVLFTLIFDYSFTAGAIHGANDISESQTGYISSTDGDKCMGVMESLLHYLLEEKVGQDGREQTTLTDAH
ncbi:hypothetical protein DPMN_006285 [Dreissena polymorpha]|uniref:Uncharacterized protein n=1 Tax=Dreissena polymorpha TaxID=45954 RepID=A0A9D4MS42_DREPO|nr:hypothetical protein DPMN_006285 [Dreissena polymorpha]